MNISVVSSSHEFSSLWHGETAKEIVTTLLDCTSLALHSHALQLFALRFHVGMRGGPWSKLPGTGTDVPAGETRGRARFSLLARLFFS